MLDETGQRLWTLTNFPALDCRSIPSGDIQWSVVLPAISGGFCRLVKQGLLAVALETGDIQLHEAATGKLVRRFHSGSAAAQWLVTTADERRLIAAGAEGDLHIIDPENGVLLASLLLKLPEPIYAVLTPDERAMAVLAKSGTVSVVPLR